MKLVTCDIKGPAKENFGLGNQLFCIATTIAYAQKNNLNFSFPQLNDNFYGYYRNNIFKKLNTKIENIENIKFIRIQEKSYEFNEIDYYENNDFSIILDGYFQSYKYFENFNNFVLTNLNIDEIKQNLNIKFSNISNYTSFHIRRGDYINKQQFHSLLSFEYYKKALEVVGEENIAIFSDDIDWCKKEFNFLKNALFIEKLDDYEDLILMSMCKNNVIANSTFSWWAAWLNNNSNKIVITPRNWFGPTYSNISTKDLIPENWIRI